MRSFLAREILILFFAIFVLIMGIVFYPQGNLQNVAIYGYFLYLLFRVIKWAMKNA